MAKKKSTKANASRHLKTAMNIGVFGLLLGISAGGLALQIALNGKVAPNTFLNNSLVAFENGAEIQEQFSHALDAYENQPITVIYGGESRSFLLSDLGIILDKTASVQTVPVITATESPWSFDGGLLGKREVIARFSLEASALMEALNQAFPELNRPARSARLEWNRASNVFEILPEEVGWNLVTEPLLVTLNEKISQLQPVEVTLQTAPDMPRIIEADLEMSLPNLEAKLSNTIILTAEGNTWDLRWTDFLEAITFDAERTLQVDGTPRLTLRLNPDHFNDFINNELRPDLEITSRDVTITQAEDGSILFDGTATDGVRINRTKLIELLEIALNRNIAFIEIPLIKTPGRVNVSQALQGRGITELVATGYSAYGGSPYNRQHNIKTAIARFNGVIVEPGETFSFGDVLGVVDGSTGYAKELVIKEGETIPEYGGGVCQVSSTLFRAILFGGLPIVERHPHSYAVSYYAYPMGYGLDATVYPPQVDLKFLNDMATPILIQAYQEGTEAYFKFYGTKDNRQVIMDGPIITNRQAPPPPEFTETADLAPGQKKKVDSAHSGFTAQWTRTVTYPAGVGLLPANEGTEGDATDSASSATSFAGVGAEIGSASTSALADAGAPRTITDTIISPYKPWAEKWQVGVDKE